MRCTSPCCESGGTTNIATRKPFASTPRVTSSHSHFSNFIGLAFPPASCSNVSAVLRHCHSLFPGRQPLPTCRHRTREGRNPGEVSHRNPAKKFCVPLPRSVNPGVQRLAPWLGSLSQSALF